MPILPSHRFRYDEREHRSRRTAARIRRLAVSFILLLVIVCSGFLFLGNVIAHSVALKSNQAIAEIFTYYLKSPFRTYAWDSADSTVSESLFEWDAIRSGEHCLRFATREYTSKLRLPNGPLNPGDAMRACRDTPIEIHGQMMKTDWCQDLGFGRGVFGFWIVDFNEPQCETRWGKFNDLGCAGTRDRGVNTSSTTSESNDSRRVESKLENLQPGSNWQIMCVTTPAEIYGRRFGTPSACFNDQRDGAIYGEWDVEGETRCDH